MSRRCRIVMAVVIISIPQLFLISSQVLGCWSIMFLAHLFIVIFFDTCSYPPVLILWGPLLELVYSSLNFTILSVFFFLFHMCLLFLLLTNLPYKWAAAIQCLKRKRLYEQQIEQLGNFQLRIHDQVSIVFLFRHLLQVLEHFFSFFWKDLFLKWHVFLCKFFRW